MRSAVTRAFAASATGEVGEVCLKRRQAPVAVTAPAAPAAATVSVALPRLAPGTYTAAWTAEGPDGHKMSGSVSFMVH